MDIDAFRNGQQESDRISGRYGLGNKLLQEGRMLEEAVEHLSVATQLDPTHVASHLGSGAPYLVGTEGRSEAHPASRHRRRTLRPVDGGGIWSLRWKRYYHLGITNWIVIMQGAPYED